MLAQNIKSVSWVAYSKVSGVVRDVLIIFLFGLGQESDAIFFSMTFIMLFQLVAYIGNVNVLGKHPICLKLYRVFRVNRKLVIAFMLITGALLIKVMVIMDDYEVSLFKSYVICSIFVVPQAIMVGIFASRDVINGDSRAHVRITSIQNTSVIVLIMLMHSFFEVRYLFLAWVVSYFIVYLFIAFTKEKKDVGIKLNKGCERSIWHAFLSPVLMFSIILMERFFYSHIEGSLGLMKLLESGAMAVNFLLEVVFMNNVIAQLNASKPKPSEIILLLKSRLLKALPMGVIMMAGFTMILILLHRYEIIPVKISGQLEDYFVMLNILYVFYFMVVVCRDYIERLYFSINEASHVLWMNLLILFLTLVLNWLFLEFEPISIALISILLMAFKVLYLAGMSNKVINRSEAKGYQL